MTITEQLAAALRGILNNCQTVRPSEDNIAFSFSDPVNPSYIVSARRVDSARSALAAFDAQPAADGDVVERVARALARKARVSEMNASGFNGIHLNEYVEVCWRDHIDRARAALAVMAAPAPAANDATVERVARAIEMALGDGDYVSDKWFGRSPKKSDATLSNAARAALAAMGETERPPNSIPMPRNLDEARAMILLGEATLRGANAPATQAKGRTMSAATKRLEEIARSLEILSCEYEAHGDKVHALRWHTFARDIRSVLAPDGALEGLRELSDRATAGPWFQWPYMDGGKICSQAPTEGDDPLTLADCDMDTRVDYDAVSCANAAFIAACVNYVRDKLKGSGQ